MRKIRTFILPIVTVLVITAIARSPFIADAKRRHLAWEARFEATRLGGLPELPSGPAAQLPARGTWNGAGRDELHDIRG